eukprot:CAMPEP_0170379846 /NCGR_PEP_ID=MMETSP0117_2-20130122/13552_1 /TAXON_ID=400756 /ORGANISM="Durinskia baltica, Strain CSIRO CS-38" /LENGTH=101 /DNA_ID=CAMNT_0010635295 /DNA_START=158 /DNA_END=460 /DNA_ORIENTATION=+
MKRCICAEASSAGQIRPGDATQWRGRHIAIKGAGPLRSQASRSQTVAALARPSLSRFQCRRPITLTNPRCDGWVSAGRQQAEPAVNPCLNPAASSECLPMP